MFRCVLFSFISLVFVSFINSQDIQNIPKSFYFFKDRQVEKLKKNFSYKPKNWYVTSLTYRKDRDNIVLPKSLPYNSYISYTKKYTKTIISRKRYKVKRKDTLYRIALKHNVSYLDILKTNNLKNSIIYKGQVLYIPYKKNRVLKNTFYRKKIFIYPIKNFKITSYYGMRSDPFIRKKKRFHSGLDMTSYFGAPIMSVASGRVIFSGIRKGYGNTIIIKHFNGYQTLYAHCAKLIVKKGEIVKTGDVIGAVGRTGNSTAAHLHFEMFNAKGKRINPLPKLRETIKIKRKNGSVNS